MKKYLFLIITFMSSAFVFSQIKVHSTGYVSIGSTTAPINSNKLQIYGNTIYTSATSGSNSAALIKSSNGFSTYSLPDYTWSGDNTTGIFHGASGQLQFTASNTEKARFTSSLNSFYSNTIFTTFIGTGSSAAYIKGTNGYSTKDAPDYTWNGDTQTGLFHGASGQMQFSVSNSEKVRITSSTTSLTNKTVFTNTSGLSSNASSAVINGFNDYSTQGAPDYTWYNNESTGIFHPASNTIGFTIYGSEIMRITSNGNIAIGSTADYGEKLFVNAGNQIALKTTVNHNQDWSYANVSFVNRNYSKAYAVYNTGTSTETFKVYGNGEVWGTSWNTLSDESIKHDFDSITGALDKIKHMKGKTYKYTNYGDSNLRYMGFIAQEIESIVPEVVRTDHNGLKGIAYQNMIPLLVEAMKEQQQQIVQLQSDLASCCSKPKSNQRIINDENSGSNDQGSLQNNDIKQNSLNSPKLYQNSPNPFSTKTEIKYFIPETTINAAILIFDMQGTLLKTNKLMNKGTGTLEIFGGELKPGMYMYSLIIDGQEIDTKKMILTE